MSIIGSNILAGASGSGVSAYELEQSLRFNSADSAYLSRTPASAGNQQVFTISFWVKRQAPGAEDICTGDEQNGFFINFQTGDALYLYDFNAASGGFQIWSPRVFRDTSAWYHIVVAVDSTQATDSNRVKVYVNGEQEDLSTWNVGSGASRYPTQNANLDWNNTNSHEIGTANNYGYLNGYLAEFHNIDGSQLDHEDFGEEDQSGVWRPIRYTGSYGTNGFYLKFDPSATNGIGHDHSGNGNNFTPTGFTTSGTGTDVMSDTPTTNWCTLNPTAKAIDSGSLPYNKLELSDGNLGLNGEYGNVIGTIGVTSGKWYWEVEAGNGIMAGVSDKPQVATSNVIPGGFSRSAAWNVYYADTTNVVNSGYTVNSGTLTAATTSGDIVGVALDMDAGEIRYYLNGTIQNSGNAVISGITGTAFPIFRGSRDGVRYVNFGQRPFDISSIPTGYSALNTSNLPEPDIADGSQYFNTVLYTGDGASSRSITGVGFQPDWTWLKRRSGAGDHSSYDVLRGATKLLQQSNNNAEQTLSNSLTSFDSDGFGVGTYENASSVTYVGWNWLAGGSGSSNTNGSITSTVSASPSSGFSVVTYTAENAVRTVGHGLGVAPVMYMTKRRDNAQNWAMYWEVLGATRNIKLDLISKNETDSTYWNDTAPTSTVFTVGTNTRTGGSTDGYVAYCFAEVEGFSKFSEYSGTGNSDGPCVLCGFRPAMVIIKNYAGGSETNWIIKDTARDTYNPSTKRLFPDITNAESDDSSVDIDFLSNGFKVRSTNTSVNENGSDYLFMAFAENPFGGEGVSPATAR